MGFDPFFSRQSLSFSRGLSLSQINGSSLLMCPLRIISPEATSKKPPSLFDQTGKGALKKIVDTLLALMKMALVDFGQFR
jgi:hypothetical protein